MVDEDFIRMAESQKVLICQRSWGSTWRCGLESQYMMTMKTLKYTLIIGQRSGIKRTCIVQRPYLLDAAPLSILHRRNDEQASRRSLQES